MTTLTAVAAGGSWGSAGTWSPAQVPTAADDCIINASMTGMVDVDGTAGSPDLCRSLDCTGCTGTLRMLANKVLNIGDASGGSLTFSSGMTFAVNPTAIINFVSTTTGNVITTAGRGTPTVNFDGAGGSWTLADDLGTADGAPLNLTQGTLNDGGNTVLLRTIGGTGGFSSNNSNTRALTMTGTWTLDGCNWDIGTSTGMTLSAGGSTIVFGGVSFTGGGLTYGSLSWTAETAGEILAIAGANTFSDLTFDSGAFNTTQVTLAGDQTVTGTFAANGDSVLNRLYITSDTKGVSRTISAGTVSVSNIDMQDITGTGAGSWNIASVTGGSGDCGRNSGITFTSPITCYMVTASSVDWSGSNWYTTSGGSTPARVPLPQDTARFDANSVTAPSVTITLDSGMARISGMDWTSVTNTPTLAFAAWLHYFGDIVLFSSMSVSSTGGAITLDGAGSNITTAGITLPTNVEVDCGTGAWAQQDDFATSVLILNSGTWAIGAHTLTIVSGSPAALTVEGGTLSSTTGTVSMAIGADFVILSGTISMLNGTLSVASNSPDLDGGTIVVGTFNVASELYLSGSAIQIGTGGATYSKIEIDSGSLAAISGYTMTVTGTAITVSSGGGGSGTESWTFC